MGKNMEIEIRGIKCDNPNCDFSDMDVNYEDYENWLNKPCPKCGCNLLTQKDYDACRIYMKVAKFLNKLPSFPGKKVKKQMSFNGGGIATSKTGKYHNIFVIKDDITKVPFDAIVNAANTTLLGGGGVDGAIHKAAGIKLHLECLQLGGCKEGEAKFTKGYNLPSPYIIHTVAPRYDHRNADACFDILRKCYENSLKLAEQLDIKRIAFPCIGTGIYHFPQYGAMKIATSTVIEFINAHPDFEVTFVCYLNEDYLLYKNELMK